MYVVQFFYRIKSSEIELSVCGLPPIKPIKEDTPSLEGLTLGGEIKYKNGAEPNKETNKGNIEPYG